MSNDYESRGSQLKQHNATLNSSAGYRDLLDLLARPSETTWIIDPENISQPFLTALTRLLEDEPQSCRRKNKQCRLEAILPFCATAYVAQVIKTLLFAA